MMISRRDETRRDAIDAKGSGIAGQWGWVKCLAREPGEFTRTVDPATLTPHRGINMPIGEIDYDKVLETPLLPT